MAPTSPSTASPPPRSGRKAEAGVRPWGLTPRLQSLRRLEAVADAVDGVDEFVAGDGGGDLLAKVLDVGVDGAVAHVAEILVHGVEQVVAREHPAGLGEQRPQ